MHELMSQAHFGPVVSSLLVDIFGTLGVALIIGIALVERARKLRQADAAEASANVNRQLQPGPAVVLGQVEYAQDARAAVRVDVDQDGEEVENSGVWSHKWTEKRRRVHMEPFYVRLESGRRIRVEPSGEVLLVDAMNGVVRVNLTSRTRYAELVPGETIYAAGQLVRAPDPESASAGGYRVSRESLVLRPRPPEPMLLSTEALGARFRERAAFHERAAIFIGVLALFLHTIFLGFHVRRFFGQTEEVTIQKLDHYTTRDDEGDETDHYRVWMNRGDGASFTDHVGWSTFDRLHVGDVVRARVVRGALFDRSTIGPDVTVHWTGLVFVPYVFIAWFVYVRQEKATRPWYEREVVDSESGRLEDSLAKEQPSSTARS